YDSVKMLNDQEGEGGFYLNYDGSFEYLTNVSDTTWKGAVTSYVEQALFPYNNFCLTDESGASVNSQSFQRLLEKMHKRNIPVTIVISPVHYYIKYTIEEL